MSPDTQLSFLISLFSSLAGALFSCPAGGLFRKVLTIDDLAFGCHKEVKLERKKGKRDPQSTAGNKYFFKLR